MYFLTHDFNKSKVKVLNFFIYMYSIEIFLILGYNMENNPLLYNKRLNDAARAGWLYFIAQNSQDEVAKQMRISRAAAQRLIALAVQQNLISFRLNHPTENCLRLGENIQSQYGLSYCEVTLTDPTSDDPAQGIAEIAADEIEKYLRSKKPKVIALGTGKEIKRAVDILPPISCPHHRIVALVGNMTPDGSANVNDPIMRIGDLTQAPRHPLSIPLFASNKQERDVLISQAPIQRNYELALSADVAFIGIGELNNNPPLLEDGFLTSSELHALQSAGALGEILGRAYDVNGKFISGLTNDRVSSVQFPPHISMPIIGVAKGINKLPAIQACLKGRWISGLITDEFTATQLLL